MDASAAQGIPSLAIFHLNASYSTRALISVFVALVNDSKIASQSLLKAVHLTQIGAACMGPNAVRNTSATGSNDASTTGSKPPKEIADAVAASGARWVPGLRALSPCCRPRHVHTHATNGGSGSGVRVRLRVIVRVRVRVRV